jgi:hypothetical protein
VQPLGDGKQILNNKKVIIKDAVFRDPEAVLENTVMSFRLVWNLSTF